MYVSYLNHSSSIFPEPFFESAPQAHILFVMAVTHANLRLKSDVCASPVENDMLFRVSFLTSILSASLGTARFLKTGPAKIVRDDKCFRGYGTLTYILIFIHNVLIIFGRGFVISDVVTFVWQQEASRVYYLLILLCFMPQLLHVSKHFILSGSTIKYLIIISGINDSLPLTRNKEGNSSYICPPGPYPNTSFQLLDFWTPIIRRILCLQED